MSSKPFTELFLYALCSFCCQLCLSKCPSFCMSVCQLIYMSDCPLASCLYPLVCMSGCPLAWLYVRVSLRQIYHCCCCLSVCLCRWRRCCRWRCCIFVCRYDRLFFGVTVCTSLTVLQIILGRGCMSVDSMSEWLYNFTNVCLHARVPIGVAVCSFVHMSELTSGGSTVYVLLVSECQFIWLYVKLPLCQTVYCSCGCLSVCVKWLYVRLYVRMSGA